MEIQIEDGRLVNKIALSVVVFNSVFLYKDNYYILSRTYNPYNPEELQALNLRNGTIISLDIKTEVVPINSARLVLE